jgi:hypothetical protein
MHITLPQINLYSLDEYVGLHTFKYIKITNSIFWVIVKQHNYYYLILTSQLEIKLFLNDNDIAY